MYRQFIKNAYIKLFSGTLSSSFYSDMVKMGSSFWKKCFKFYRAFWRTIWISYNFTSCWSNCKLPLMGGCILFLRLVTWQLCFNKLQIIGIFEGNLYCFQRQLINQALSHQHAIILG